MSEYYGTATLEDWLYEEVFNRIPTITKPEELPVEVIAFFEKWREGVENNIERWMCSDDGDGNNLSWREWGRGFAGIPDEDDSVFEELTRIATIVMVFNPVIDTCDSGHKFAKLKDHPVNNLNQPRCPQCLSSGYDRLVRRLNEDVLPHDVNIEGDSK